jgi:hypothetical protein
MAGTPGFTNEEIREFVHEYHLQPHGTKGVWLALQSFTRCQFEGWRRTVFSGDLDRNLVPRDAGVMTIPPGARTAFEKTREKERTVHAKEKSQLVGRIRELEQVNEALGKAIGLVHEMNVPEPAQTEATVTPEKEHS